MTIRECFPTLVTALERSAHEVLNHRCSLRVTSTHEALFRAAVSLQDELATDMPKMSTTTKSLIREIVECKTQSEDPAEKDALNFLQVSVAVNALGHCLTTGQLARAGDWLIASVSDELSFAPEPTFGAPDVQRLEAILNSDQAFIELNALHLLCQWTSLVFWYCSRTQSFVEFARLVFPFCLHIVRLAASTGNSEALAAACRMAEWAGANDHNDARELAHLLESMYGDGTLGGAARIASTLSTAVGRHSSKPPIEWTRTIVDRHWETADAAIRLRAIVALISEENRFDAYRDRLLTAISEYQATATHAQPFEREQWREQAFITLYPVVLILIRTQRIHELIELLSAWYEILFDDRLVNAVFVLPFLQRETIWADENSLIMATHDESLPRDAVAAVNRGLRVVITHDGYTGLDGPHDPRLTGSPDLTMGGDFERILTDLFAFSELPEDVFANAPAVPFISGSLPFQSLSLRRTKRAWPISASLVLPDSESVVRKVGIWLCPLLHGDLEAEIVRDRFQSAGVSCELHISSQASDKDRFLSFYARADFDVVWVIGHGERRPHAPDENSLEILQDGAVHVRDLVNLPLAHDRRRLLVLNVCSAGSTVAYGGLPRVGIAAMLTTKHQSTISHLWPVLPEPALAFGIFLAGHLANADSFFRSHCAASVQLVDSTTRIAKKLRESAAGAAADIIERRGLDMHNILVSGSPVFLQ
ncbi:MAG TPA: hypothetical protein VGG22_07920 [Candidatus Baltobacteraceae bacterium]|jgi:hypothetical protein